MILKRLAERSVVLAVGWAAVLSADAAPRKVDFNRDIRPILSDNCYACHGPDEKARKAKLRLDVAESALAKKAVVPKDLKHSELWARISTKDANEVMPPADSNKKPLRPEQLALLKQWIEEEIGRAHV